MSKVAYEDRYAQIRQMAKTNRSICYWRNNLSIKDFKEEKEIGMESVFIVKEEPDIPDANKAIRRLRASLHMSRKQFAESLNYESSQVVRIEYGVVGVSGRMRRQIKAVYGIDLPQNVPTENTKRKRKDEDYEVPDGEQNRRGNA